MGEERLWKVNNRCHFFFPGHLSFPTGCLKERQWAPRPCDHLGGWGGVDTNTDSFQLFTGKSTSHIPQICFALNSSRKTSHATQFTPKRRQREDISRGETRLKTESGTVWMQPASLCLLLQLLLQKRKSAEGRNYSLSPLWAVIHPIRLCQREDAVHLLNRLWFGVGMSTDNYCRTRRIMSRAPAMPQSHKQATMAAAPNSTWARAKGAGRSQQTMNIYFPPCVCVSPWCVNNARPTSEEPTN